MIEQLSKMVLYMLSVFVAGLIFLFCVSMLLIGIYLGVVCAREICLYIKEEYRIAREKLKNEKNGKVCRESE
ncbi:MAG: hypothetical protein IKO38_07205 [Erysipelotrichaceae bacterium]|nr:hypothetical protein [Erysipelotrichaceae bacterium]